MKPKAPKAFFGDRAFHPSAFVASMYARLTNISPLYRLTAGARETTKRYRDFPCSSGIRPDANGLYGLQSLSSSIPIICGESEV